jgi:hypothetical protein
MCNSLVSASHCPLFTPDLAIYALRSCRYVTCGNGTARVSPWRRCSPQLTERPPARLAYRQEMRHRFVSWGETTGAERAAQEAGRTGIGIPVCLMGVSASISGQNPTVHNQSTANAPGSITTYTPAIEGMHISYLLSVEYKCLLPTKSDSRLDKILDSATLYRGRSRTGGTICPM